jgi:hypothetical protein
MRKYFLGELGVGSPKTEVGSPKTGVGSQGLGVDSEVSGLHKTQKKCVKTHKLIWIVWAHLDLNQGPTDYESVALTN